MDKAKFVMRLAPARSRMQMGGIIRLRALGPAGGLNGGFERLRRAVFALQGFKFIEAV